MKRLLIYYLSSFLIIILASNCYASPAKEPNKALEVYDAVNGQYIWFIDGHKVRCINECDPRFPTVYIGLHFIPNSMLHDSGWYYFNPQTGVAQTKFIKLDNNKYYYACDVPSLSYGKFITGWQLIDTYYCYFDRDDYSLKCCLTPMEYWTMVLKDKQTEKSGVNRPSDIDRIKKLIEQLHINAKVELPPPLEPYALEDGGLLPDKNVGIRKRDILKEREEEENEEETTEDDSEESNGNE